MNFPLAEISTFDGWVLGCTIIASLAAVFGVIVAVVALNKKQEVKVDQPLEVTLEEKFVSKNDFDQHASENVRQHENLFSNIGGVERGMRAHLDQKLDGISADANAGREKLHDRINEVLVAVYELRGTVTEMRKRS